MKKQILITLTVASNTFTSNISWALPSYMPNEDYNRVSSRGSTKTRGGTRRGDCDSDLNLRASSSLGVMAIVPRENSGLVGGGLTSQSQPIIWVYVPYSLRPDSPEEISATLQLEELGSGESSLQNVDLSRRSVDMVAVKVAAPLQENKLYRWTFNFVCPNTQNNPSSQAFDEGLILYKPQSPIVSQSNMAIRQSEIYASNGYWYDAVSLLAPHRRRSSEFQNSWNGLLQSAGLTSLIGQ